MSSFVEYRFLNFPALKFYPSNSTNLFLSPFPQPLQFSHRVKATPIPMEAQQSGAALDQTAGSSAPINLLFMEMGVGYDQHGNAIFTCSIHFLYSYIFHSFNYGKVWGEYIHIHHNNTCLGIWILPFMAASFTTISYKEASGNWWCSWINNFSDMVKVMAFLCF